MDVGPSRKRNLPTERPAWRRLRTSAPTTRIFASCRPHCGFGPGSISTLRFGKSIGLMNGLAAPRSQNVLVPLRGHEVHPMRAAGSNGVVHADGATPMAMTKAIIPSIRPRARFLESLRLPAASRSMTALAAHMLRIGLPP
jgi:hypothetical protein